VLTDDVLDGPVPLAVTLLAVVEADPGVVPSESFPVAPAERPVSFVLVEASPLLLPSEPPLPSLPSLHADSTRRLENQRTDNLLCRTIVIQGAHGRQ
jgi:hypothetical protein